MNTNFRLKQEWGAVELDFEKVNETLKGSNQTQIWRLLQALRWVCVVSFNSFSDFI